MLKKHLFIAVLVFIYGCSSSYQVKLAADNQSTQDIPITKKQSDIIFKITKIFPNQTQLSIAIIENGVAKFYGIKRENDTIVSFSNKESVFEIGSISKTFTATLLSNAVLNGKLKLDDPINDYIDFSLKDNIKIPFKTLANHSSGLPGMPTNFKDYMDEPHNPFKNYNEEQLKEYLVNDLELSQNPGEKSEYSNLGYSLLGYVIAEIEKSNYQDLLETNIFSKYNMKNSTTIRDHISTKLVRGLDEAGKEVPNWDLSVFDSAGAILSTVEDLSKFTIAQFDDSNKELVLSRIKTVTMDRELDVALGWLIRKKKSPQWYWHNGGTGGYTSSLVFNTENKNGVIILSNVTTFSKNEGNIDKLCFELMKTIEK